jgi:superfamily II DNA/RNA helicase
MQEVNTILAESGNHAKMIIFANSRKKVHQLAQDFAMERLQMGIFTIDGSMTQQNREHAMNSFKNARPPCALIATAVAERGMNINDVTHVILFEMPKDMDDYVHRIGRTARGDQHGKSIALFTVAQDAPIAKKLVKVLKQGRQTVPSWLQELAEADE